MSLKTSEKKIEKFNFYKKSSFIPNSKKICVKFFSMLLYLGLSYLSIMVMAKAKTKETTEIKEEKASKKNQPKENLKKRW